MSVRIPEDSPFFESRMEPEAAPDPFADPAIAGENLLALNQGLRAGENHLAKLFTPTEGGRATDAPARRDRRRDRRSGRRKTARPPGRHRSSSPSSPICPPSRAARRSITRSARWARCRGRFWTSCKQRAQDRLRKAGEQFNKPTTRPDPAKDNPARELRKPRSFWENLRKGTGKGGNRDL